MAQGKHDNRFLRLLGAGEGFDPPMMIRCDAARSVGRPIAAVTLASVENVYLLHRPDGLGSPLDERHGPVFVDCRCPHGHRLDQRKVLAQVKYGARNVPVSDVACDT